MWICTKQIHCLMRFVVIHWYSFAQYLDFICHLSCWLAASLPLPLLPFTFLPAISNLYTYAFVWKTSKTRVHYMFLKSDKYMRTSIQLNLNCSIHRHECVCVFLPLHLYNSLEQFVLKLAYKKQTFLINAISSFLLSELKHCIWSHRWTSQSNSGNVLTVSVLFN